MYYKDGAIHSSPTKICCFIFYKSYISSMSKRNTTLYIRLSLFKLIVWLVVLVLVWMYIDPFQDPQTWVILWSIWLLFFVRWLSYFIFYYAGVYRSDKKLHFLSSFAYKASLLLALYMLTNILLIIIELWTFINGFIITILFWLLYRFIFYGPKPEEKVSIDMVSSFNG